MPLRPKKAPVKSQLSRLVLLVAGALAVEAALLALAHWQWQRYQQRQQQRQAQITSPATTLTGTFSLNQTMALDNQPSPQADQPGWRLLTPFVTASATYIIDRGWYAPADRLAAHPDFSQFSLPAEKTHIVGIWQPVVPAHGWLRGPLTTTSPQVLARLEPTAIISNTLAAPLDDSRILQLTQPLPGQPAALLSQPTPTPDPLRHLSYFYQWLAMAVVFPLLCWGVRRR